LTQFHHLTANFAEPILKQALEEEIALLVVGDPFGATTQ
jgi:diphthamide biosynthesis methyltransferase